MGYFDDIVPPDGASSYVATPPGGPRITVRPKGVEPLPAPHQLDDMPTDVGLAPSPRTGGLFDDIVPPAMRVRTGLSFGDDDEIVGQVGAAAARTNELARHKAAIESALSTTVPFRLQHSRPVEIAAGLMSDHGMSLDEALDRATMRLHATEGTAEAGKISDVIGKDAFDEAQRVAADGRTAEFVGRAASPDLAQPAQGVGQSRAATEAQARPDGEYTSGDRAAQGGAAGGRIIGSEGAVHAEPRAQSRDELTSAAAKGEGGDIRFASGRNDATLAHTSGGRHVVPTAERIGDDESRSPPAPENLLWRLASPLTDIPHEIYQAGAESLGTANTYLNPWSEDYRKGVEADRGKWIGSGPGSFLGTGKGLLAAASVPFAPITGAFRSLIGHPFSVIMPTATPQEQERMRAAGVSEDMIPGQTREENYQKVKRDVDLAMMAARPFGFTPRGAIARTGPQPPARPPDTAAAQSDRMNSGARASGPSSFEGKEQHALGSASASAATNSVATATAAASGPKLIGSFTPRADLKYGGTKFGNHAHQETGSMLQDLYKDVGLILRVKPGQRGIDVSVPKEHIASLGFAHAEIKPLSASGEKKLQQQIWNWGYDPSTVRAITYDANGNVYFGFR
jgi:hypothetical protein